MYDKGEIIQYSNSKYEHYEKYGIAILPGDINDEEDRYKFSNLIFIGKKELNSIIPKIP